MVNNLPAKAGDVGSIPGKIPHVEEQPRLCTTTTEPVLWSLRATTAEATKAEATTAEATTTEATKAEAVTAEATKAEATTTEAATAEATKAEAKTAEAATAEATKAEATTTEARMPAAHALNKGGTALRSLSTSTRESPRAAPKTQCRQK